MGKLLLWRSKITKWFSSQDDDYRVTLFFVLSIILGLFVTLYFEYDSLIFWTSFVTSFAIIWSLYEPVGVATVAIDSLRVTLAWGFINYSLFVSIASSLLFKKEWGISYIFGIFVAFITSYILVVFCSYISYLLKLNDEKEDISIFYNKASKFNRCGFYIVSSLLFLIFLAKSEGENIGNYKNQQKIEQQNIIFGKEEWYPINEWHTEIVDGNTIYVIKCAKGRVGIYPSKYPQIRDINSNTKIKYIKGSEKGGVIIPEKLEIKN